MMGKHRILRAWVLVAVVAAFAVAVPAASASAKARCHPSGLVLARRAGVVLWSVRHRSRTSVYLCARSKRRAELVASGGARLYPGVSRLKVAGGLAAFVLTTTLSENENLVVFDFAHARRELTHYLGCFGSRACAFATANQLTDYALAADGWVAEVWRLGSAYGQPLSPYVNDDETMVTTDDGVDIYSVDFGSTFSRLVVSGDTVTWTSDLGGISSLVLGQGLPPPVSPLELLPCQLFTPSDISAVLGSSTISSQPGRCAYTSRSKPAKTLTVGFVVGPSAQPAASESSLQSTGWDAKMSAAGGFHGYQKAVTIAGVNHQQLYAFPGGVELSLDLTAPGPSAGEQLAWLSDVAFDRLFAIPVQRAG